jgi:hypothetical protein
MCLETTIHVSGGVSKERANWGGFVKVFYDLLADGHINYYILFCGGFQWVWFAWFVVNLLPLWPSVRSMRGLL